VSPLRRPAPPPGASRGGWATAAAALDARTPRRALGIELTNLRGRRVLTMGASRGRLGGPAAAGRQAVGQGRPGGAGGRHLGPPGFA
jgi:hypothetical protein